MNFVDICILPADKGNCEGNDTLHLRRYYFDDSRGMCLPFAYSGCQGNLNNFDSEQSCVDYCRHRKFIDSMKNIAALEFCFYILIILFEKCFNKRKNLLGIPQVTTRPRESDCERFERHCDSLRCQYGILKSYEASSGCERCSCEDPCENKECPQDSKCSVDISSNDYGETVFVAICRQHEKSGRCPRLDNDSDQCEVECYDDADCREDNKCCISGCSRLCVPPSDDRRPQPTSRPQHQEERATELEEVSEEDLQPVAREGGVATLRCFATGFPPPSITWRKGGLEVSFHENFLYKKILCFIFFKKD